MTNLGFVMCKAPEPVFYLAYPYKSDPSLNVLNCIAVAAELVKRGYKIIPPIIFTHHIHEKLKSQKENPELEDPDFWYNFDEALMQRCDGIIMAGDYRNSKGCMQEMWWFKGAGRQVLFLEDILAEPGVRQI